MPFIPQSERAALKAGKCAETVGQYCYEDYTHIMKAWNKKRRWTTIHNQLKSMFGLTDGQTAKILAFLEFYVRHGHTYEMEKSLLNGDIDGRTE